MKNVLTALTLALSLSACAGWQRVPVEVNPASSMHPETDMKALLNQSSFPGMFGTIAIAPIITEVTDQYLKAVYAGGGTQVLTYAQVADIRVINRGDIYQVSAFDARNKEFYAFRPSTHDLATCKRFLNTFYALSKKTPPTAGASSND